VYLDSAATTQKPEAVLRVMDEFYRGGVANPNRGLYPLSAKTTEAVERSRETIAKYINAAPQEIIFTKSATEAINLVARSFGETLKKNDRIVLTLMEHHSNIVPWLQLRERNKIDLDWIVINNDGEIDIPSLKKILEKRKTKLVTVTGLSNVLGSAPDLRSIVTVAHEHGAKVLVDAAQMAAHCMIDVQNLNCDFLAFSGHKIYGPTGIGVLFGKRELLESMPPFLGGGDMIRSVTNEGFTAAELPRKFEAGSAPTAEIIGLGQAIEWVRSIPWNERESHESELIAHAMKKLQSIEGLTILGSGDPKKRKGCISFTIDGVHPHDLTEILGRKNICLRAGHHCTQPLHDHLGINASARLSIGLYNSKEDIDVCVEAIKEAKKVIKK